MDVTRTSSLWKHQNVAPDKREGATVRALRENVVAPAASHFESRRLPVNFALDRSELLVSLSTHELVSLFERALAQALPESRAWKRDWSRYGWSIETSSTTAPDGRNLAVAIDGHELTVYFYVGPTGVGRGPYEANDTVPDEGKAEVLEEWARFVADLVEERLVLVYRRGWLKGGRDFIEPTELTPELRQRLEWVASWRGTYDWRIPR